MSFVLFTLNVLLTLITLKVLIVFMILKAEFRLLRLFTQNVLIILRGLLT